MTTPHQFGVVCEAINERKCSPLRSCTIELNGLCPDARTVTVPNMWCYAPLAMPLPHYVLDKDATRPRSVYDALHVYDAKRPLCGSPLLEGHPAIS